MTNKELQEELKKYPDNAEIKGALIWDIRELYDFDRLGFNRQINRLILTLEHPQDFTDDFNNRYEETIGGSHR